MNKKDLAFSIIVFLSMGFIALMSSEYPSISRSNLTVALLMAKLSVIMGFAPIVYSAIVLWGSKPCRKLTRALLYVIISSGVIVLAVHEGSVRLF